MSLEFGVCLRSLECSKTMVLKYENGGFASRKGWGVMVSPRGFFTPRGNSNAPPHRGEPKAKPKTWDLEIPTSKLQTQKPNAAKFQTSPPAARTTRERGRLIFKRTLNPKITSPGGYGVGLSRSRARGTWRAPPTTLWGGAHHLPRALYVGHPKPQTGSAHLVRAGRPGSTQLASIR